MGLIQLLIYRYLVSLQRPYNISERYLNTGLADRNMTFKRIIHFWTNSLNIFMIGTEEMADTLPYLGELSPEYLTKLVDLTSPDCSKFKFKILKGHF